MPKSHCRLKLIRLCGSVKPVPGSQQAMASRPGEATDPEAIGSEAKIRAIGKTGWRGKRGGGVKRKLPRSAPSAPSAPKCP